MRKKSSQVGLTAALNEIHYPTAYLKPINTHYTLSEGQNGKLYGSGPDPFPPPRKKGKGVATRDYPEVGLVKKLTGRTFVLVGDTARANPT